MTDERGTGAGDAAAGSGPFARIGAEIDNLLRSLVPSDQALDHFANARLEVLKGMRAIIDARIDRVSGAARKGVTIKVE